MSDLDPKYFDIEQNDMDEDMPEDMPNVGTTCDDEEELGRPQTPATRRKIAKAMTGDGNSQYKDGRRLEYRKMVGLKKGDKRIVHHKDGDRFNNSKSNLEVENRSEHDKNHQRGKNFSMSGGTKKARRFALRN